MREDKWLELKEKVLKEFEVIDQYEEKDDDRQEVSEIIEFSGPMGKMMIEWITRPKLLDKKTIYSNRVGAETKVDYVYSEDEVVHEFKIYKFEETEDDWLEINAESFLS